MTTEKIPQKQSLSDKTEKALFTHYISGKKIDECQDVIISLCNGKESVADILLTTLIDAVKEEAEAEAFLLGEGMTMDAIYNHELQYSQKESN